MTAQSRMHQALDDVRALEQGIVLNDWYDTRRYVLRRATYLSNNSRYKDRNIDWFTIARRDAAEIFDSGFHELSVQDVRRRELLREIEPLLPLPTTQNTQTIDSFRSYPDAEWTSEEPTQGRATQTLRTSTQGNFPGTASMHGSTQSSLDTPPQSLLQRTLPSSQPSLPGSKVTSGLRQAANTITVFNRSQQTGQARLSDMSSSPLPDISFSSSFAIDPLLLVDSSITSMEDNGNPLQLEVAETQAPADAELIRKIIDRLGKKPAGNAPTTAQKQDAETKIDAPQVYYSQGVSALANRGMISAVKKRPRRDTRDPSEESSQSEDTSGSAEEVQLPPSKKRKGREDRAVASLMVALPIDTARLQAIPGVPPKVNKKKASASTRKPKPNHIDDVVSGKTLPRTAAEATSAAETRLAHLLANHNASKKASKRRSVQAGEEPDFMPEYFNVKKFPEAEKEDQVRCACGVIVDDGYEGHFVACDKCGVWQHMACMGLLEGSKPQQYVCHVCDPWVHRELLAKLRRKNQLR